MLFLNRYYSHQVTHKIKRCIYERRDKDIIAKNKNNKMLVILHFFYPDSWKEIKEYLKNLDAYDWDLCVSYPNFLHNNVVIKKIKEFKKDTNFFELKNVGYDVAPFLFILQHVDVKKYDLVIKIQTKGVRREKIFIYNQLFLGRDWFTNLYEGLLGEKNIHKNINILLNDKKYSIVCAKNLIVTDPPYKQKLVAKKLNKLGKTIQSNYKYVAGTCFMCEAEYLLELMKMEIPWEQFENSYNSRGMSLAHVFERYICNLRNVNIYGVDVCIVRRTIKKPIENAMRKLSSENLLNKYAIDDEFFYWKLDNKLIIYKEKKVPVGELKYFSSIENRDFKIEKCIPYMYLKGNKERYYNYCEYHLKHNLPAMSVQRFDNLINSIEASGYNKKNIILVNERNMIYDGQHRACVIAYKNGLSYTIDVLEIQILNKKQLLKMIIPMSIRKKYYLKKYKCY